MFNVTSGLGVYCTWNVSINLSNTHTTPTSGTGGTFSLLLNLT